MPKSEEELRLEEAVFLLRLRMKGQDNVYVLRTIDEMPAERVRQKGYTEPAGNMTVRLTESGRDMAELIEGAVLDEYMHR